MGCVKEFYHCRGCDELLVDLDVVVEENEESGTIGYICPLCGTKNERKIYDSKTEEVL